MSHWWNRTSATLTRGQSMVEFALALPLLAMLSLGALDVGRAFVAQMSLASAAREGARYCAAHADETGAVDATRARVRAELGTLHTTLDETTVTCTLVASTNDGPPWVTVTPSITFTPITPYAGTLVGHSITLWASATMLAQ
jgi:Flp pilus assembly protein TadG